MSKQPVYWLSPVGERDDFGRPVSDEIIDACTKNGMWGLMTPASFAIHGRFRTFGTGMGQRYKKQADGRWLKVEG